MVHAAIEEIRYLSGHNVIAAIEAKIDSQSVLKKDSVLAHMWSNIAGANGNARARKLRDILEVGMTRAEVSRATELARVCMTSDYQDCEP